MRKLFFAFSLLFFFTGCSIDEDPSSNVTFELVPIISTNLPDKFIAGETYDLLFTYSLPTSCHKYKATSVEEIDGAIVIGVISYIDSNGVCAQVETTGETGIRIVAEEEDFYIFKFWQGRDEQGEDQFLTIEIPVESNSS